MAMTATEVLLANQLIVQGLSYWQAMQAKQAAGTFTRADLEAAAAKLDADIDALEAAIFDAVIKAQIKTEIDAQK